MAKKGQRPPRRTEPSDFDISFDPIFQVGAGDQQRYVSARDILYHRQFKDTLAGKPKAVAATVKMIKLNARAREDYPPPPGPWTPRTRYGKPLITANAALQLLGIASEYWHQKPSNLGLEPWVDTRASHLGLEPWVIDAAHQRDPRCPHLSDLQYCQHVRPEQSALVGRYSLADDPQFAPPVPKRPAGSTRFAPGRSGNPRGRPRRQEAIELPFDDFFLEPVTLMIEGEPFEGTRLQALIHQANLRAIKGDDRLAVLLANAYANEQYRVWKRGSIRCGPIQRGEDEFLRDDPFQAFLMKLRLISRRPVRRVLLEPRIVEASLCRLGDRSLTVQEQAVVVRCTSTPEKVRWPAWWEVTPEWRRAKLAGFLG